MTKTIGYTEKNRSRRVFRVIPVIFFLTVLLTSFVLSSALAAENDCQIKSLTVTGSVVLAKWEGDTAEYLRVTVFEESVCETATTAAELTGTGFSEVCIPVSGSAGEATVNSLSFPQNGYLLRARLEDSAHQPVSPIYVTTAYTSYTQELESLTRQDYAGKQIVEAGQSPFFSADSFIVLQDDVLFIEDAGDNVGMEVSASQTDGNETTLVLRSYAASVGNLLQGGQLTPGRKVFIFDRAEAADEIDHRQFYAFSLVSASEENGQLILTASSAEPEMEAFFAAGKLIAGDTPFDKDLDDDFDGVHVKAHLTGVVSVDTSWKGKNVLIHVHQRTKADDVSIEAEPKVSVAHTFELAAIPTPADIPGIIGFEFVLGIALEFRSLDNCDIEMDLSEFESDIVLKRIGAFYYPEIETTYPDI